MSTFIVPPPVVQRTHFQFGVPRPRRWWWPFKSVSKHSLPLVQHLDADMRFALAGSVAGVSKENLTEESARTIWDAQLAIIDRYAPGVVARLTDDQLVAILREWIGASTISVGESSASSSS